MKTVVDMCLSVCIMRMITDDSLYWEELVWIL